MTKGSVTDRVWQTAFDTCTPLGVTIELTTRCNLRCVHCYNFDRAEKAPGGPEAPELGPAELSGLLGDLARAGGLFLCFTGGEPLLHPSLDDLVRHARRLRFATRLKTNGTLLTTARVARLVEAGLMGIDVSLYGATAATHDALTREEGSFDAAMLGIRNAVEAGLKARASLCLLETNAGEMEGMLALVGSLGIEGSIDPHLTTRCDGTRDPLDMRVDRATLKALYEGPLRHLLSSPDHDPGRSVQCSCARSVCAISATGDVYPCVGAPIPSGNVREATFEEIWRESPVLTRIRNLGLDDFAACKPCPDRPYCRRSSGVAYTNTGDYTGPEPWTCMEASVLREIHEEAGRGAGTGTGNEDEHE